MYSPRIKEELISRLYLLCQELKIPMTAFVNGATERALVLAEECVAKGAKEQVFGMIGVEAHEGASDEKE
jgi:hypothetical protein